MNTPGSSNGFPLKGNKKIEAFLVSLLGETEFEGQNGQWEFYYAGVYLLILTDERHNRMRIIAPILNKTDLELLQKEDLFKILEVNFALALDAKYTIWRKELWSCFVHPLDSLSQDHFNSGVSQVANLVNNYGSTYSSSNLRFNS